MCIKLIKIMSSYLKHFSMKYNFIVISYAVHAQNEGTALVMCGDGRYENSLNFPSACLGNG